MHPSSSPPRSIRRWPALFAAALLLQAGPALAWDISVGTNFLSDALYVDSASGTHTWTTIQEGVRADTGTMGSIPINWTFQSWNGTAWPSIMLDDTAGVGEAHISHNVVADEYWDSAEAFIFGAVAPDATVGAGFAYDFELVVDPFSSANVFLDDLETFLYMESEPGDEGTAFAQFRLFSTDVALNDPGGANDPWARVLHSLTAPPSGGIIDVTPTFSHDFVNNTGSAVTYNLRFEGSVSVFEVPEPATWALLGITGLVFAAGRRGLA